MGIFSRLPGCVGQAPDAVPAKAQVKMEDASTLLNNSKVRMPRFLDGQEDGVSKARPKQAAADPRGSQTCVCANTYLGGWHMQGEKGELTSCRGTVQSETQRRKSRAARKGKWPPRGTGTTVLTYPGSAPRGTGRAGENGQNSGEMGGSSSWTRPSAPGCGDTLKALASGQRLIKGGDRPRRRLRGRCRLGYRPVVLPRTDAAQCTVRPT